MDSFFTIITDNLTFANELLSLLSCSLIVSHPSSVKVCHNPSLLQFLYQSTHGRMTLAFLHFAVRTMVTPSYGERLVSIKCFIAEIQWLKLELKYTLN